MLQSEALSTQDDFPSNVFSDSSRQTRDTTRTRWINAVDPAVCLQALDRILGLRQAEKLDRSVASVIVRDICSASNLKVQRELVVKLKRLESHLESTLLAEIYRGSPIPNETTLAYLQDVSLQEMPSVAKRAVVYRILQYYQGTLSPYIGRRRPSEATIKDWRGTFPVRLLRDASFRDAVFHYLDDTSESRQRVTFTEYKLELLQMLYEYNPDRTVEALWEMVRLDLRYIGLTTRKTIRLLRVYDPERTVQEIVGTLKEEQRYYRNDSISILEFLEDPEADELLIGNIQRYADKFTRGTKSWRGGSLQYWRESLRHTVEAAGRRELDAIKPHLVTIVLRNEPANVKVTCVNALIVLASEEEVRPILVKLLNDRYAQVRNLCAKHLLKMKQHQTIEQLIESFGDEHKPKWPFLSDRHKQVMLVKIELLRKLQDTSALELLSSIASSEKDEEVADAAAKAAAVLR